MEIGASHGLIPDGSRRFDEISGTVALATRGILSHRSPSLGIPGGAGFKPESEVETAGNNGGNSPGKSAGTSSSYSSPADDATTIRVTAAGIDSTSPPRSACRRPYGAAFVDFECPGAKLRCVHFEEAQPVQSVMPSPGVNVPSVRGVLDFPDGPVAMHERPNPLCAAGPNRCLLLPLIPEHRNVHELRLAGREQLDRPVPDRIRHLGVDDTNRPARRRDGQGERHPGKRAVPPLIIVTVDLREPVEPPHAYPPELPTEPVPDLKVVVPEAHRMESLFEPLDRVF